MLKAMGCGVVLSMVVLGAGGVTGPVRSELEQLPVLPEARTRRPPADWLVTPLGDKAGVYRGRDARELVLNNGLISRTWRLSPNAATVAFDNLMTEQSLLRGVKPEALLQVDGAQVVVGGLSGQPNYAYLKPEWLDAMRSDPAAFQFTGFAMGATAKQPWPTSVGRGVA